MLPRQVPGFILHLTRAYGAFWGQSIRFGVEKLFSEKVSPHFPSTPGSEELIAHPLPKFPPMDPAEEGEPEEPQALPSAPLIPSHVGGPGGFPALLGKTGTTGRCWQEKQGVITRRKGHIPSAPQRGAQPWERAPPRLP